MADRLEQVLRATLDLLNDEQRERVALILSLPEEERFARGHRRLATREPLPPDPRFRFGGHWRRCEECDDPLDRKHYEGLCRRCRRERMVRMRSRAAA